MISRRNIRIKVMQSLYTVATMDELQTDDSKAKCVSILNEKLNRSLDLYVTSILYILKVAQYAERNAQLNQSKLIPTDDELQNNTKIAGNLFLWQILSNETFTEKVKIGLKKYSNNYNKAIYTKRISRKKIGNKNTRKTL